MKVITSRWNMVNQIYKWKSERSLLPVTRSCCNLLKLENIRKFLIWKNSKGVANVGDNPLCQATKWHLRVKWGTKKHRTRIVVCFSLSSVVFVSSAWKTVGITNMSAEHVLLPTWSGHKTHTHLCMLPPPPPPPPPPHTHNAAANLQNLGSGQRRLPSWRPAFPAALPHSPAPAPGSRRSPGCSPAGSRTGPHYTPTPSDLLHSKNERKAGIAVLQVVTQVHTTLPHLQTSCTARMNERQE